MKRMILSLIIVILALPIAYSAVTFVIEETEKVSIQPDAKDPDSDQLTFRYSPPLDEAGQWQTDYGDAGEYKSTVEVSDGINSDSREIFIIVKKKEEKPIIESYIPKQDELSIKESESLHFSVIASDLNNDPLQYLWIVDGKNAGSDREFSYTTGYSDAGTHSFRVEISDGTSKTHQQWTVNVIDLDVGGVLDLIPDVSVKEGEVASIDIPDLEGYGITYTITDPIGNDNAWKTNFDDEGIYNAVIHAEGRGFSADKTVRVTVEDVDVPPKFEDIGSIVASEGEEIKIELKASDPDSDKVSFSADDLPKGAELKNNVFSWTPSFDTVQKGGFFARLLGKFGVGEDKTTYIKFKAKSKDVEIIQNAIITVKDVNRAPIIEDVDTIMIKEGQALSLSPDVYDPDGDKVKVKYKGLSDKSKFASGFDDAGAHKITIFATDGKLESRKDVDVIIENSNRAPVFSLSGEHKVSEGEPFVMILSATDPDGEQLNYTIDNPPRGSYIRGNAFFWTPEYDTTEMGQKKMDLVFVAQDKTDESRGVLRVTVENKNRPPRITEFSPAMTARINKPVLMSAKASDDDGDDLKFTWGFNMLESYDAQSVQRVFTTRGLKKIKLIVSDGKEEVEQFVNVNVI